MSILTPPALYFIVVMADPVTGVNRKILTWARERSGLSIAQVAKATGRAAEEIEAWESDSPAAPTYAQLETLAYDVYKRPIALFFFPEPPHRRIPSTRSRRSSSSPWPATAPRPDASPVPEPAAASHR